MPNPRLYQLSQRLSPPHIATDVTLSVPAADSSGKVGEARGGREVANPGYHHGVSDPRAVTSEVYVNATTHTADEQAGAATYTPAFLRIYDLYVLHISNPWIWKCRTSDLQARYNENVSGKHLDLGPGSGYFLQRSRFPVENPEVTLFDLNPNSLAMTSKRIGRRGIKATIVEGSVLSPFGIDDRFDSVAANYLMHCVPGGWADKGIAFKHAADVLDDNGVFFGSTILGTGVEHSKMAERTISLYTQKVRSFHNADDDLNGLTAALDSAFEEVETTVAGSVALWTARKPRRNR